jgi:phage recombination protein Bet
MTTSLITILAGEAKLDNDQFVSVVKKLCCPANISQENFLGFLLVAHRYRLDPILKQIYCMQGKSGQIIPVVSVDGWIAIINGNKDFDGMTFEDHIEGGKLVSITCRMHRKSQKHPVEVTEYLVECLGTTEPWKRWPARMLRHKSMIQAARYAFGLSGIYDQDEAERIVQADAPAGTIDGETGEIIPAPSREAVAKEALKSAAQAESITVDAEVIEAVPPTLDEARAHFADFDTVPALADYMNHLPKNLKTALAKDFKARMTALKTVA